MLRLRGQLERADPSCKAQQCFTDAGGRASFQAKGPYCEL